MAQHEREVERWIAVVGDLVVDQQHLPHRSDEEVLGAEVAVDETLTA